MDFSPLSHPENCNCGRGSYPLSRGNGERAPPMSEEPCLQCSLEDRKDGTSKAPSGFFISLGMWETELLGIVKSQLLLPNELRRIYFKKRWYWGSILFVFKDMVLNLAGQIFLQGLAVLAEPNPKPIEVRTNLSLDSSEFWVRPLQ